MRLLLWFFFFLRAVLVFTSSVYIRSTEASCRREMPEEVNDVPHLLILQNSLPARHSAVPYPILENPLQLAVRVRLNILHRHICHSRIHLVRERYSGIPAF